MKKIIIITTVLISLLSTLLGMFFIRNKELSKNEFIALMKKFENASNVKLEGPSITYKKDDSTLVIYPNDICSWSNTATDEYIRYSPTLKQYSFLDIVSVEDNFSDIQNSSYTFIRL